MKSDVSICNLALSHIGETADLSSISPPDNTAKAEICASFYYIARDSLLEMHDWKFATKRFQLSKVDNERLDFGFCYSLPPDFLRAIKTYTLPKYSDLEALDYEIETDSSNLSVLYSNYDNLMLHYVARVEDAEDYSPLFALVLSWHLASMIAGSIIKGIEGMKAAQSCVQAASGLLIQATASDSSQMKHDINHIPDWIKARQ
jgi:hypothetical protein